MAVQRHHRRGTHVRHQAEGQTGELPAIADSRRIVGLRLMDGGTGQPRLCVLRPGGQNLAEPRQGRRQNHGCSAGSPRAAASPPAVPGPMAATGPMPPGHGRGSADRPGRGCGPGRCAPPPAPGSGGLGWQPRRGAWRSVPARRCRRRPAGARAPRHRWQARMGRLAPKRRP